MALRIVDIRTKTDQPVLVSRSMIPDEVIGRLVPVIRRGRGAVAPGWSFERDREFVLDLPRKPPGTAFAAGLRVDADTVVVGGIRFSLAHDQIGTVLTAWVASRTETMIAAINNDIVKTIDRHRDALGSLCPMDDPALEPTVPLLAVLRMPAWLHEHFVGERAHLEELQAQVGWSVIEALSHERWNR